LHFPKDKTMNRVIIPTTDIRALRQLDCDALQQELDRAEVLPGSDVPADVVTLDVPVRYRDETAGESRVVTLVYPHEADVARGRISVVAPVGAALLGLSAGQSIDWEFPGGALRRLRVLEVLRGEAAG
jgi:regulator of nucleoside diphosphate kinase